MTFQSLSSSSTTSTSALAPSTPSSPSLASSLPNEIVDLIFSHIFNAPATSNWVEKAARRQLTLVCRSWYRPAQRYLFKSVSIHHLRQIKAFTQVVKKNLGLAQIIQKLEVNVKGKSGTWNVEELKEIVDLLPNLNSLFLSLNPASPTYTGDYSKLGDLPNLKELSLYSDNYDPKLKSYRQIISRTPNITSLTLSNGRSRESNPPTRSRITTAPPINLPKLNHLALKSVQFSRTFDKLELLSAATAAQITHLELDECQQWSSKLLKSTPIAFLKSIAINIRILLIGGNFWNGSSDCIGAMVALCSNLETFITKDSLNRLTLPKTLKIFKYSPYSANDEESHCSWLLPTHHRTPVEDWGNVERIEMENVTPNTKVNDFFFAKGMEVIVNGAVYVPSSTST